MLKKICQLTAISFAAVTSIEAQTDSTKKIESSTTFTYSVDVYYKSDFAGKANNNKTSFTNSNNSFELGMASIRVDHSFGKISATADLGFGRRAEEFSYNDGSGYPIGSGNGFNTLAAVKQAYLSYSPVSFIKFTAGKWATHIGWELLDAYANRNYSMSYGFSYGPFFHTGLKADISIGGKSAMMVGIANPTDFSTTTSQTKIAIAQFSTGTKDDKFKGYLNFQGGTYLTQFDLVLNAVITSKFNIAYDGTIKNVKVTGTSNNWSSNALYFNYDPTAKFGLTLRGEYFNDTKNVAGIGTNIFAATLSGNIKINNLTIIPEIRLDNAKNKIFTNSSNNPSMSAGNFLIAAVYKF
ncbi:outer membrane beta-barrel protein [Hydrotalea sp.]|uniref:outer membrane beta-barrel protein n=1 Tax=Hydrotalea sp. TaxID=2881279 RepID=UPI00260A719D|nr:outer membrane beta-barrel protein [Hydrotalea sp.]